MTTRTITALFDSPAEAERAVAALVSEAGIDRAAIRTDAGGTGASQPQGDKGFLASLRDLFVPEEDRYTYAEGLRRGSVLVSAQVDDSRMERAADVLERHGAVDLDEREAEWRRGGWSGYTGAAAAGTGAVVGAVSDGSRTGVAATPGASAPDGTPANPSGTMLSRGVDQVAGTNVSGAHPENEARGTGLAGAAAGRATATGDRRGEEAIPIVEERLRVGKREVERGRVRVRSYVVETPVQEQVTLREERVDVERRAVDRPVTDADRVFQDRTIEAAASAEEAIVAKEARVTEEVVVRKGAEERVQTVQDTVRRTEVEVEDDRRAAGTTETAATRTGKPRDRSRDRT